MTGIMEMRLQPQLKGALSLLPGLGRLMHRRHTGGSGSADYCYGVWLKHLCLLGQAGMRDLPRTVVELGPGDSLGTGLAAVLTGADHYYALDALRFADPAQTLTVFERLVTLFQARAPRPVRGWPDFDSLLDSDLFPGQLLSREWLAHCLSPARLTAIREAIGSPSGLSGDGSIQIHYRAPWTDAGVVPAATADLVLSHTVLQHINDLDAACSGIGCWLRPGGWTSHQVDYTGMELCHRWNGFRSCPEWRWRIIRGHRPYLINREPPSTYQRLFAGRGLQYVQVFADERRADSIPRESLAPRWQGLSDADLYCAQQFLIARKQSPASSPRPTGA